MYVHVEVRGIEIYSGDQPKVYTNVIVYPHNIDYMYPDKK